MKTLHRVFTLAVLYTVTVLPGCLPGSPPTPPQGPLQLNVPYAAQQTNYYCVPASIWMVGGWVFSTTPSYSQNDIWQWMETNFPGHVSTFGGVLSTHVHWNALNHFVPGGNYSTALYNYQDRQQAVADQDWRLRNNKATMVMINDRTHVVVVKGSTWYRLSDAIQRPLAEYVTIHDPERGPNQVIALGTWMNFTLPAQSAGSVVVQWIPANEQNVGQISLQSFDDEGGVYMGPPPPDPSGRYRLDGNGTCYWEWNDFGTDQCSPSSPGGSNVLASGGTLYGGQYIDSLDGRFRFIYQNDGNLVLYGPSGALWATMTFDTPGSVEMQTDGNLVMYNSGGAPIWHSATNGASGAFFVLQNDGNGIIYAGSTAIWATNTGGW